jgi:DNA repair photolyase
MAQKAANPETIRKELENGLKNQAPKTPLGRAIKAKKTIRFGKRQTPTSPLRRSPGVSRQILSVFNTLDWSYVVQTKFPSLLVCRDIDMLKDSRGLATVMIEMSPGLDWDWEHLESKLTDPPKVRLEAAAELKLAGVGLRLMVSPLSQAFIPLPSSGLPSRQLSPWVSTPTIHISCLSMTTT